MKKKILAAAFTCLAIGFATAGLSSCGSKSTVDKLYDDGYTIKVTYDANGGNFLGREGVSIIDMFNPSDYEAESDGTVKIKLLDPTSPLRPSSTGQTDSITLLNSEHFLVGWYQSRELVKNSDGKLLSEDGKVIIESAEEGKYVYADNNQSAVPAYTYSDPWDFTTDKVEYTGESIDMTLYAAWSLYFKFDYYYEVDGAWQKAGTTSFNYKTVNAEGSTTSDKDTIVLPDWSDGAMNYKSKYANGEEYSFPSVSGMTFESAYTDEECTQKIEKSFTHPGTLDFETGVAQNRVQNIYVKALKGDYYKIETASQFVNNVNVNGYYEILADLDFTGLNWSLGFMAGEFNGKIYTNGETRTFKNITANCTASATSAGLFGTIGDNAEISNISFENVTVSFSKSNLSREITYGLFAGYIREGATLTNVSFGDGCIRFGSVQFGSDYSVNLFANGFTEGIELTGEIKLVIFGTKLINDYSYGIDYETVTVDENKNITFDFTSKRSTEAEYEVNYTEV